MKYTKYSCENLPCPAKKSLAVGHIAIIQTRPNKNKMNFIKFVAILTILQAAAITDAYTAGRELIEDPAINVLINLGIVKTSSPTASPQFIYTMDEPIPTIDTIEFSDVNPESQNREFEDYVSYYSYGKIKYSSPEYKIDVILPDGYICESYYSVPQGAQEEIKLQYELDMKIDIIFSDTLYMGFDSLEKYYEHYHSIYNVTKDKTDDSLYESLRLGANIPYCLFTFLYDNDDTERWVYYELICYSNGVWYATKFNYPANHKDICDNIVGDYVSEVFA